MSFAVLRTLDYTRAGFDTRKKTAITQLGAGRNSKLQLQFATRYWNTQGPWGARTETSSPTPASRTRGTSREDKTARPASSSTTRRRLCGLLQAVDAVLERGTNAQVATYAMAWLKQLESVFPGITSQWTGKATLSTPFLDPLLNCSYSYWKPGQYVGFSGYEGVAQGNVHFAGEHCSVNFQGYMEGGAAEGVRAASEILALLK